MSLLKHTFLYSVGKILPQFIGFLLLPIYTSVLTTKEYGIIESLYIVTMVLTIFFSLASERSMFRLYYDYKTKLDKQLFIGNLSIIVIIASSCLLGLTFLFSNQVSLIFKDIPFNPFFIFAILTSFLMTFSFIPQTLYQVEKQPIKFLILSISTFVTSTLFILYFILYQQQGAIGLIKGRFFGYLCIFPFNLLIIYKASSFKIKKRVIKNILNFSIPMIPILLTAWILNMSNRIFIEQYFSLIEVGIFSLAFRISSIVTIVLGGLFTAFNPVFYSLSNDNINIEESKNKLYNLCKIISFTVLFTCFSVCLVSKEIISLFFDKSYSPAIGLIPLIIVSILLVNISGLFNLMIYQEKKPKTIMYISIVGAFLSILLNFLLVPRYGMIGAAYASIITALIIMVSKYVYARKAYYIGLPIKSMFFYFVLGLIVIFFDMKFNYNLYYSLVTKCVILGLLIIVFYIKNKSLRKLIT